MNEEPHFDQFPQTQGNRSIYASVLALILGQYFTISLSIGFLYWTSPLLSLALIALATIYLYSLCWKRALRFRSAWWKISVTFVMLLNYAMAIGFLILLPG